MKKQSQTQPKRPMLRKPAVRRRRPLLCEPLEQRRLLAVLSFVNAEQKAPCSDYCFSITGHPGDLTKIDLASRATSILPAGVRASNWSILPLDTSATPDGQSLGRLFTTAGSWIDARQTFDAPPVIYVAPNIAAPSRSPYLPAAVPASITIQFSATLTDIATGESASEVKGGVRFVPVEDVVSGAGDITLETAVKKGATGLDVAEVEQRLRWLGYRSIDGQLLAAPDGIFNSDQTDQRLESALKLFQAATVADGSGDPLGNKPADQVTGIVDERSLLWLNAVNAPRWVDASQAPWNIDFPLGEPFGTHWAAEITAWAHVVASNNPNGPAHSNGISNEYSDSDSQGKPHVEHKAGLDIDFEVNEAALIETTDLPQPLRCYAQPSDFFTAAERKVISDIVKVHNAAGDLFQKVLIGGDTILNDYARINDALRCLGIASSRASGHDNHFHVSLKPPQPMATLAAADTSATTAAFNEGIRSLRQSGNLARVINQGLGFDLPIVAETAADFSSAVERFTAPFLNELKPPASGEASGLATVTDTDNLASQLKALRFQVQYVGTTPDASGDLLRATYQRTWDAASLPTTFGLKTGFEYLDSRLFGGDTRGSVSASIQPVTLSLTLGVDVTDGVPKFYVSENSSLIADGITLSGSVQDNVALGSLLDVDIAGSLEGNIAGTLSFIDPDADSRLRIDQFANPASIVHSSFTGTIAFNPSLTAHLPIIGALTWGASGTATISNGRLENQSFTVQPPPTPTVEQLLKAGFQAVAGAFDLFGGKDLNAQLPVVGKGLREVLGLPEFLTGGKLGESGFEVRVTPESVQKLIDGEIVDLIHFESRGGDDYAADISVPVAGAVVPLGPIPLSLSLSFGTEIHAGWSYYVGLGIDTAGFYIDPRTSVAANGSIQAGLTAEASVLGLAGIKVSAGVGASLSLGVGLHDPDPRDGRIYLDELISARQPSLGNSLLAALNVTAAGEAFAYARGVAEFLFWEWEVFNERSTIASFSSQLSTDNRRATVNRSSQRKTSGRSPLSNGILSDSLLQNGVLTLDMRQSQSTGLSNTVSVTDAGNGKMELQWRDMGRRTYEPGQIQRIVYIGDDRSDHFFVGQGISVPVEANGNGGNDLIQVESAPATIRGGDGHDTLRGGTQVDSIWGDAGDDQINGGGGDDVLHGDQGNDRIEGSDGQDQLLGEAGIDVLIGGLDNDQLDGGLGNDTLYGGQDSDRLDGGAGEDILYGDQGDDTLHGSSESDVLVGGAGKDNLYGGDGNDTLFGDRSYAPADASQPDGDDALYGQDGDDRLYGEGGNDRIEGDDNGQSGADLLVGDQGGDTLLGGAGADQLWGGADSDTLQGGDGDDVLNGEGGKDYLFGDAGDDTLQFDFASSDGSPADETHGGLGLDQIAVVGTVGREMVNGKETARADVDDYIRITHRGANTFTAENLDSKIQTDVVLQQFTFSLDVSASGDIEQVTVQGLGGNDRLVVGSVPEVVDALDGRDFVLDGGDGDDRLEGGQGRDVLHGGAGDDKLFGRGNDDLLYGDEGRDELDGGTGSDFLDAGEGDDIVRGGDDRSEVIEGGDGNDFLVAGSGIFPSLINGGIGDDTIIGGPGRDVLSGNEGNDTILGGDLDDKIDGNAGDDLLIGELGRDTINGGDGNDVIYAYLNNDVRSRLGLPLVVEMSKQERKSHRDFLAQQVPPLEQIQRELEALPEPQKTAREADLIKVSNQLTAIRHWLTDLDEVQGLAIDTVDGARGNDEIYGSPFADLLYGNEGDDNFYLGHSEPSSYAGDKIFGGASSDTVWYEGTEADDTIRLAFALTPPPAENPRISIDLDGDGIFEALFELADLETFGINSLSGDDTITTESMGPVKAGLVVDAGAGDDRVDFSAFQLPATLRGGSGNDTLIGGPSSDRIIGDAGDDVLSGGDGDDTIEGGAGSDRILGEAGNNFLYGGPGDDYLSGGSDNDSIFGGGGNDRLISNAGDDRVYGGPGDDSVENSFGTDTLVYSAGNDVAGGSGSFQNANLIAGGSERPITSPSERSSPLSIAMGANRSYVMIRQHAQMSILFLQGYNADGQPVGPEQQVNAQSPHPIINAIVKSLDDGTFVVVWAVDHFGAKFSARRYDSALAPIGDQYELDTSQTELTAWGSSFDVSPTGTIVIVDAWRSVVHLFRLDGVPIGSDYVLPGGIPAYNYANIAMHQDGSFLVAWAVLFSYSNNDPYELLVQRFSPSGSALGYPSSIRLNTSSTNFSAAAAPDGGFVVAWSTYDVDEYEFFIKSELFMQRFSSDGQPIGEKAHLDSTFDERYGAISGVNIVFNQNYQVTWNTNGLGYTQQANQQGALIGQKATLFPGARALMTSTDGDGNQLILLERLGSLYLFQSDVAPPTVLESLAVDENLERRVVFSELLRREGTQSVTERSHWTLESNGVPLSHAIKAISRITDAEDVYEHISIEFLSPLAPGEYVLTARSAIVDKAGRRLDGNGDGVEGDDYVERFTVSGQALPTYPPEVLEVSINTAANAFVVAFSQEMATSGPGSVLDAANWALQLPNGRYLVQDESDNPRAHALATRAQLGTITYGRNSASGRWEVTIPLIDKLDEGSYQLTARGSLQDAAGQRLAAPAVRTLTVSGLPPTARIVSLSPDPLSRDAGLVTIEFDEDVTGVDVVDFQLTRNGLIVAIDNLTVTQITPRQFQIDLAAVTGTDGSYALTLRAASSGITDVTGNSLTTDAEERFIVDTAPIVAGIALDEGASQGNGVHSIVVTFNSVVEVADQAFMLYNQTGAQVDIDAAISNTAEATQAVLTFRGAMVNSSGALLGGNYSLTVIGARIHDTSGQSMAESKTTAFESVLAVAAWQNAANHFDVNGDGFVSPIDALLIINQLNTRELIGSDGRLPLAVPPGYAPPYLDTSNDGYLTALDALLVINQLNLDPGGEDRLTGEAEAAWMGAVDEVWASDWPGPRGLRAGKRPQVWNA